MPLSVINMCVSICVHAEKDKGRWNVEGKSKKDIRSGSEGGGSKDQRSRKRRWKEEV